MTKRGPSPLPTAIRKLRGTERNRPKNEREPMPETAEPPCPSWLPAGAKREWSRLVPELLELGVLSRVDRDALAGYCIAVDNLRVATETIAEEGRYQKTPNGYQAEHPAVAAQKRALETIRKFGAEFGLTPASRTRVQVADDGTGGSDETEQFLFGDQK
jgi:P27 family predicted phage terminase small subunit